MSRVSFCQVILFFLHFIKEITSQTPCLSTPPQPLRCGGTISSSGFLYYSPYELIGNNERCVWTLSTSTSSPIFQAHILYMGFPYSNDGNDPGPRLTISGIPINETTYHIVSGTGKFNITGASRLVIVLSSGANAQSLNTKGFIMEYNFGNADSNHFVSLPPLHLQYNPTTSYESATSLVVVPPTDNYFPGTIFPLTYFEAMTTRENLICAYRQDVFYFDRNNISHPWSNQTSFCNGVLSVNIPGHDDILMTTSTYQRINSGYGRDQWYFNLKC